MAKPVYRSLSPVTRAERARVRRAVHCLRRPASRRIARAHLARYKRAHRIRVRWAYYRSHPMPYCTWANESGKPWESPEWPPSARYSKPNSADSGAYGKYQIMPSTWTANGGGKSWSPLNQERVARNLYAARGTQPWDGCG